MAFRAMPSTACRAAATARLAIAPAAAMRGQAELVAARAAVGGSGLPAVLSATEGGRVSPRGGLWGDRLGTVGGGGLLADSSLRARTSSAATMRATPASCSRWLVIHRRSAAYSAKAA